MCTLDASSCWSVCSSVLAWNCVRLFCVLYVWPILLLPSSSFSFSSCFLDFEHTFLFHFHFYSLTLNVLFCCCSVFIFFCICERKRESEWVCKEMNTGKTQYLLYREKAQNRRHTKWKISIIQSTILSLIFIFIVCMFLCSFSHLSLSRISMEVGCCCCSLVAAVLRYERFSWGEFCSYIDVERPVGFGGFICCCFVLLGSFFTL